MIDDVMEIARLDAGIRRTEKTRVSIPEMVGKALNAVRPQADARQIELVVDLPTDLVGWCDEMQMSQVVRNLADNAVKYSHDGGSVCIRGHNSAAGLVMSVADTGLGIPQGEVDRIFERFYRVDKARSRYIGGTGLGLAIVKEIVESH